MKKNFKQIIKKAKELGLVKNGKQAFIDYPPTKEGYFLEDNLGKIAKDIKKYNIVNILNK